ncbi:MAG: pilus assembly PilX N-terminal domain-containing protein [Candidatus Eisenbacteria bacterium]
MMNRWKNRIRCRRGSGLVLSLLLLTALSLMGMTLALLSATDRRIAAYDRQSISALNAAEAGIAMAKRRIQDRVLTFGDENGNGYPDFRIADTLSWGGIYDVFGESTLPTGSSASPYSGDMFRLEADGYSRDAVRRVFAEIAHDTFLKYARFVEAAGTSYGCGAILTGEVYVGGTLGLPSGCTAGSEVEFLEMVAATNGITNKAEAIFHKGYTDSANAIDLQSSVDMPFMRAKSKGEGGECDCEGLGRIGIYMGWNLLGIGANGTINLSLFDFVFPDSGSSDTVITYGGNPVVDPTTGSPMLSSDFNGIIFYEGDGHIRGTSDGVSARNLTVFATDDIFVEGDIRTGHSGYDDITRLPNHSGDPVNIGLVAADYIYIGNTPRILFIDAALMAVAANWRVYNTSFAAHPVAPVGNYDLDQDGIVGETPQNNDPNPGEGWDEVITAANQGKTWVMNINGPIITHDGGSAYPWNEASVLANADGPTRRYNYDMDITDFPPPCFPVPLNLWMDHSWAELYAAGD